MSLPDHGHRSLPRDVHALRFEARPPTIDDIQRQGARPAAVLVPILMGGSEPRVVFTERTTTLSRHAGEISFPGGLADPGEDLGTTALREAEEEPEREQGRARAQEHDEYHHRSVHHFMVSSAQILRRP